MRAATQSRITFLAHPPEQEPGDSQRIHSGRVKGHGPLDVECGECGELVVEGGDVDTLPAFLFECPKCESLVRLDLDSVQRGLVLVH